MSSTIPILDADKTIHFDSPTTFAEALRSVISAQWIMVAPKTTIRLQDELHIKLRFDKGDVEITAKGTPFYWRGPFLGMQVEMAGEQDVNALDKLARRLESGDFSGGLDAPAEAAPAESAPAEPAPAEAAPSTQPAATPMPSAPLAPLASEVEESPEEEYDLSDEPTQPSPADELSQSELLAHPPPAPDPADIASPPEPIDIAAPPQDVPPAADPAPAAAPTPAAAPPAAPAVPTTLPDQSAAPPSAIPSAGFSGVTNSASDLLEEMLQAFPAKGTGYPLPAEASNYRLFSVLAANSASGELEITSEQGKTLVFFRRGSLLAIEPFGKSFDEYFASILDKAMLNEPERFEEVIQFAEENDKSLALSLYEKRVISLDMLSHELKASKEKCLGEVLIFEGEAQYAFRPMQKFNRRFDPIRVDLRSALVGICRQSLLAKFARHIEPRLEGNRDRYPRALRDAEIPLELLSLSEKEEHAVKHVFTGANRLMDTYSMCLLTRHGAARLVLMLTHFGLMEYLEEAAETQSGESIEEVLVRTLDAMRTMDHFQRLEIHWAGHPSLVEKGLEKTRRRYGPQSSMARRSDEARETCAKLVAIAEESHQFLLDKANRRRHRIEHYGEAKMKYAAEFLASQAELNMFRGAQDNAIQLIEAALELSPNPSFVTKLRKYRAGQR